MIIIEGTDHWMVKLPTLEQIKEMEIKGHWVRVSSDPNACPIFKEKENVNSVRS